MWRGVKRKRDQQPVNELARRANAVAWLSERERLLLRGCSVIAITRFPRADRLLEREQVGVSYVIDMHEVPALGIPRPLRRAPRTFLVI